jgi:hypothetical protein
MRKGGTMKSSSFGKTVKVNWNQMIILKKSVENYPRPTIKLNVDRLKSSIAQEDCTLAGF